MAHAAPAKATPARRVAPRARAEPRPTRSTLDLAARIDHSLPKLRPPVSAVPDDRLLLASLGLLPLLLASASLLWLLHVRAEELR